MTVEGAGYVVVRPDHARRLRWSWRCLTCGDIGYDQRDEADAEKNAQRHVSESTDH